MNAHTPGPWKVDQWSVDGHNHYAVSAKSGSAATALCGYVGAGDDKESVANAHLIAAAPELLAMLQEAVDRGPVGGDDWAARAREVIAKATGEQAWRTFALDVERQTLGRNVAQGVVRLFGPGRADRCGGLGNAYPSRRQLWLAALAYACMWVASIAYLVLHHYGVMP